MKLFLTECRRLLHSAVYWLTLLCLVFFLASQGVLPDDKTIEEPQPGAEQSVLVPSNDPALIMPEAVSALYEGFVSNNFSTYPHGLIKHVKLTAAKQGQLAQLLAQLTGLSAEELLAAANAEGGQSGAFAVGGDDLQLNPDGSVTITGGAASAAAPDGPGSAGVPLRAGLAWEEFTGLMEQADRLLGGGSDWAVDGLSGYGRVPATYDALLEEYQASLAHDRYTGAHARLFCDYAVCMLSLLPAFTAAAFFWQDRRRIAPVLYTRRVSGAALICARFLALVALQFLPVLLLGGWLTVHYAAVYGAAAISWTAFFTTSVFWLLPTLLLVTALSLLVTVATGTPAAVALQALWWFSELMGGTGGLSDGSTYGSLLAPRHNSLGQYLVFQQQLPRLAGGRLLAAVLAVLLTAAAVAVFERKRKGGFSWHGRFASAARS
ncbi:hypothetical protein H8S23_11865 [Anaerofilum sp. BX8]|uniref:Uncharacterized protein n=1 Tax=Anaerofilum hominis TaxID=2763016 RepID=A0A923KYM1_9FIRM|nr:hypothetical protein [Anaerofilum hominis]MBC5582204.1 hypothetical protein [Anaerofilum hominis]